MERDAARVHRLFERAIGELFRGHLGEAARLARTMEDRRLIAMVAVHEKAWERAARKTLSLLKDWDELDPSEERPKAADEATVLRILELAAARMAEERVPDAVRRRRGPLLAQARERLESVEWEPVRRHIRRLAEEMPEIYGPLATERLGRRLVRDTLAGAADLLLAVSHHAAESALMNLGRRIDPSFARTWPICLHCFEQISGNGPQDAQRIRRDMRAMRKAVTAQYAEEPKDREHALLLGAEALALAQVLARGGDPVDDLLQRADALLAAAPGLRPSGEMERTDGDLLAACVGYYRGRAAELRGDFDAAVALLAEAADTDAEPWSGEASEALVRVREVRDSQARRRRVVELRARWRETVKAGDVAGERSVLAELVPSVGDVAMWERLSALERDAAVAGWVERASDAVRRGSRDPAILAALAEEAVRRSATMPRQAVALFRLALQGGGLPPDASKTYADALLATGRAAEAGRAYEGIGATDPARLLDAARAYAAAGESRHAIAVVDAMLASSAPPELVRDGFRVAASVSAPDALRATAHGIVAQDPGCTEAAEILARLAAEDERIRMDAAVRARGEGLAAVAAGDWPRAAERLAAVPPEFLDATARAGLAQALERVGRYPDAFAVYARLPTTQAALEGRARCSARLGRFADARAAIRSLVGLVEDGTPAIGDDPDLLGLLAEERGDLTGAAARYEDPDLLRSLAGRARAAGDAIAEYGALWRLEERTSDRAGEVSLRLRELDALVPVRAKGRHAREMPALVLCDTNVILADLVEDGDAREVLDDLRRPGVAERLRALRRDDRVRLAVTRTVARELRAVLRYHAAVQEDEEGAAAVAKVLGRAEALVAELDVERVAGIVPEPGAEDVGRVRAFYGTFRTRLRGITERKAGRAPERSAEIVRRRTRGRAGSPGLPEAADLRLLAEAAWLAGAAVPGIGRVAIASDDADFRSFRAEIERAFGVGVA